MTHYLQEELTSFWGRLTPYLALLAATQHGEPEPIGRVTIDADDRQAFVLHVTDARPSDDASQIPTGHSATYTRLKADNAAWGPWLREAY
jgi:hypothetical protein